MGAILFFTTLGVAGIAASFALGLVAPLLQAARVLYARSRLASGRRTLSALDSPPGAKPLRRDLSPALMSFAADTRLLLTDLEHAAAHSYRFADASTETWWQRLVGSLSGSTYAPTIGMTGEAWRWLRQGEGLLDETDGAAFPELEAITAGVRALLFDARPLNERWDGLQTLLLRAHDGLSAQSGAPYRDRLLSAPCPSLGSAANAKQDCTAEARRRRQYADVLGSCETAISALARRFAAAPDRDDLAQEIRLSIWNALPAFRGECSLRSYALRVAKYRAINFKERRTILESAQDWSDDGPRPDDVLQEVRQRQALGRAVRNLPSKLRFALELRLEGFTYREIASRLAISEKNASVRVSRARQAVKQELCPDGS